MARIEDYFIHDFGEVVEASREILSHKDTEQLVTSLTNLTHKILSDFPNELPDVLFPETTGRLLEQPVLTLLAAAANQRNVPLPEGYFFVTASGGTDQYLRRYEELVEEADQLHLSVKEYLQRGQINSLYELRFARLSYDHTLALKIKQEASANTLQTKRANTGRSNNLIMVDDTISLHGNAIRQIREAFHDDSLHGYALFGAFQKEQSDQMIPKTFVASYSRDNYGNLGSPFGSLGGFRRRLATGVMKSVEPMGVTIIPYERRDYAPYQEAFQKEMAVITVQAAQNLQLPITS